jgi:hypothetical protein
VEINRRYPLNVLPPFGVSEKKNGAENAEEGVIDQEMSA